MEISETTYELLKTALTSYLSAGDKPSRAEASEKAKEAYKSLTGEPYMNPRITLFRITELEIRRNEIVISPMLAETGEKWTHLGTGTVFEAENWHGRTIFRTDQHIQPGAITLGDKMQLTEITEPEETGIPMGEERKPKVLRRKEKSPPKKVAAKPVQKKSVKRKK
jgi:hypothetical protein